MSDVARTVEQQRLMSEGAAWKKWGPYLSDRAWGTVREDDGEDGNAWSSFPHDHARSRAYRWGEDGIGGISDVDQRLNFALALWNGHDPIIKERLFGLTNGEGNHGEDVKEYYFYTDSTPTHSWMRMVYKYPQRAFPYDELVATNAKRSRAEPEYELVDTGIFAEDRYFDVVLDYAKAAADDLLIRITVTNRGPQAAPLHLLPTLWFRNTWSWGPERQETDARPRLSAGKTKDAAVAVVAEHELLGRYVLACDRGPDGAPHLLFTENETNRKLLFGQPNLTTHVKDGINDFLLHKTTTAVNPLMHGTKCAAHYRFEVPAGETVVIRLRLRPSGAKGADFADFDQLMTSRQAEADAFYQALQPAALTADQKLVQRQAWAGMLWSKQWFAYHVPQWQRQQPEDGKPRRRYPRNAGWHHFEASDVISMPDKWEYPWFAAWDLAFHTIALAYVDIAFAKQQLLMLVSESYQHPNGAISAYEWNFDDVNPPVLARAAWRVYAIERDRTGTGDRVFLEVMLQKLSLNYAWWVNRKDATGNNLFQGGFLGLDNIGVFDRSKPLPTGGHLEQSDGTSWMAVFTLDLLCMALELSYANQAYAAMVEKYLIHYLYLDMAMNNIGEGGTSLWDAQDGFFYDALKLENGTTIPLKVRSMVGLIPLYAVVPYARDITAHIPGLGDRLTHFVRSRPRLAKVVERIRAEGVKGMHHVSLIDRDRLAAILTRMLDEKEFLSPYGIRALSKHHEAHPYQFFLSRESWSVNYVPAESDTGMFGGNSNWRGPIWMPVNYFLITSLRRYHLFYGPAFTLEYPTGSGVRKNLSEIADDLSLRLVAIFTRGADGRRPVVGDVPLFQDDPHWRDLVPFYEYFHGDTGRGVGASHQTGWTGLVAALLMELGSADAVPMFGGGVAPSSAAKARRKAKA